MPQAPRQLTAEQFLLTTLVVKLAVMAVLIVLTRPSAPAQRRHPKCPAPKSLRYCWRFGSALIYGTRQTTRWQSR